VLKTEIEEHRKRERLQAARNLLFERFSRTPQAIHLAVEIKLIEDQIAEYTDRIHRTQEIPGKARHSRSKTISA
jgi:hypothetical protein